MQLTKNQGENGRIILVRKEEFTKKSKASIFCIFVVDAKI